MIKVEKVTKRYLYTKSNALNELSFEINRNESCALVGNNGCGKTTIIKILCNLINYNSGDIYIHRKRLTPDYVSYKNSFGIVLSSHYFIEEFSLLEYLYFVAKFQKVGRQLIKGRIDDLISLLSLETQEMKKIKTLSSGNQMKVSLAAALIHNPETLILDEPFVNLDIATIEKVMSILKSFREKKTLIITSHNLELITELCDKFLIVEKGHVVSQLHNPTFENTEELKRQIKDKLLKDNKIITADWLN